MVDRLEEVFLQSVVLPRVMEQIIQCKDNIAQQYLMQCVIQGFPDDFHVGTLDVLLAALPELQGSVKVHIILASMLDRLARYSFSFLFHCCADRLCIAATSSYKLDAHSPFLQGCFTASSPAVALLG